jgi:C-terminal processing protease CtpA/Prc
MRPITFVIGAKFPALVAAVFALGVFLSVDGRAVGQADTPFEQKLKELEKDLVKVRQAMLKEIADESKRVEESLKSAKEALDKASKAKDKPAVAKAKEALGKAEAQKSKVQKVRSQVEKGITLMLTPPLPVVPPEQRLGIGTTIPNSSLASQLALPKKQGLVIDRVDKDSAAAKAGLQQYDVLLQLDGKPVPSDALDFRKQLAALKPDGPVDAVVVRQGKQQTIKLAVPSGQTPAGAK